MITCTRRLEFDYGHRVHGHGGKCRHLHGHRGVAEITVSSPKLDSLGMVIDFSVIKERVGGWIDQCWDHNLLLNAADPLLHIPANMFEKYPYIMVNGNPTAENMAKELFAVASELLHPLTVENVRLYETPNSYADCPRDLIQ